MSARWYARPVLFVADIERAAAFYVDKLGFREDWRFADDGKPIVVQVARSDCEMILSCQRPEKMGAGMIFVSLDLDVLNAARTEFEAKGVSVRDGWWGYRCAIVDDPDGNQLYFAYPDDEAERET